MTGWLCEKCGERSQTRGIPMERIRELERANRELDAESKLRYERIAELEAERDAWLKRTIRVTDDLAQTRNERDALKTERKQWYPRALIAEAHVAELEREAKTCPNVNWHLYEGKGMTTGGGRESGGTDALSGLLSGNPPEGAKGRRLSAAANPAVDPDEERECVG